MPVIRTGTNAADKFFATSAAEAFDGLGNYDIVNYTSSTGALTIDLGNAANNSGNAAGDTFANIEYYILGRGADHMTGSATKEQINGYFGNDTIDGAGGDDILIGHAGDDTLNGGIGNDNLWGGGGIDTLSGGANNDRLVGDMGNDTLSGGDGNDFLQGGTGNDSISGGNGIDTARLLGNYSEYDFTYTATGVIATHARGSQADGVEFIDLTTEFLQFADVTIARPSAAPTVAFTGVSLTDTGVSASDNITNNATVTFSGTAGDLDGTIASVQIFNGTVSLGFATISGNTWSLTAALADGTYDDLRAVATDNSGVTGQATNGSVLVIDRVAPAAPSAPDLSAATDSLPVDNDDITNLQTLDLSGTAEAGSTVRLYDANTNTLLSTAIATGGVYAFTVTVPSGAYNFAVTAEDVAGNVGSMSSALTVIVDTQASTVVGLTTSSGSITFTASDDHGPLSLLGTFAGLGAVNNGMSTTLTLTEQATAKFGTLQVQDIAGNPSNVIGLGLGTAGANTFTGPLAASANALYGFGGDDILAGGTAGDVLYGGDANDRLVVTAGGDTLDGGAGTSDIIDFSNAASGVTFSLAGAATQNTGADFGALTWFGIEGILGGSASDTLTGDAGANTLSGQGGSDQLTGGSGVDTFNVTSGADIITDLGNGGADSLTVSASASASATLAAAWTATSATVNNGTASVSTAGFSASVAAAGGSAGWTLTNAGSGTAVALSGGSFADTLIGGGGADTLIGGAGADQLSGGAGGDFLYGGSGGDTIDVGHYNDNVRDFVRFSATGEFGDTVTDFDVDGTQDMVQFTGGLVRAYDDGNGNLSIRWAQSSGNGSTPDVTVGQANNHREGLLLKGANGEGVTNANLGSASAVAAAFSAEFDITAANGEDAILVVNDTNGNGFSVWQWIQSGGGEVSAGEITLIGMFEGNGTVTTNSFGFF